MTAAPTLPLQVTEPGIYPMDMPTYLADPVPGGSLSSHGARLMLPPSCPALFQWRRTHPEPSKKAFDLGTAVHTLVFGDGPELVVVQTTAKDGTVSDADSYNTKSAQHHRDEIRASGRVPLLPDDYAEVQAIADAVRRHPLAGKLFEPGTGQPEQSLFWVDEPTGVWRRARLDWLRNRHTGRRLIVPDLKTAACAEPNKWAKSAADIGYHAQAAFHLDGVRALGLDDEPVFLFVVVETTPPYLVSVVQLDEEALRIGRILNRTAINLYRRCTDNDHWPGYSTDVEHVALPGYYTRQFEEN